MKVSGWTTASTGRHAHHQDSHIRAARVVCVTWRDVVLLVQGELLTQEQILSGQSRTRTEAETPEAQDIQKKREQRTGQRYDRMLKFGYKRKG